MLANTRPAWNETDGDLGSLLHEAREVAVASNALFHERVRAEWVRRGQVDVAMVGQGAGASPSPNP